MPSIPGSTASAGRRAQVELERAAARSSHACSSGANSTPGVSLGTTNPGSPFSSVAHTIETSLTHPFVFHFLCQ